MAFYVLKSMSSAEEYVQIKGKISDIKIPAMKSEIHHLDKKKIVFDISEDGGLEVPDLIYYEGIFLVSDPMKRVFDSAGADYVFWKEADIHSERFGIHETFWMIVPPRIDCIDMDKSKLNPEWDFDDGLLPMLEAERIVIDPKLTGRFQVFKILGIMDNNIYVAEELYEKITSHNFEGVTFIKLQK